MNFKETKKISNKLTEEIIMQSFNQMIDKNISASECSDILIKCAMRLFSAHIILKTGPKLDSQKIENIVSIDGLNFLDCLKKVFNEMIQSGIMDE